MMTKVFQFIISCILVIKYIMHIRLNIIIERFVICVKKSGVIPDILPRFLWRNGPVQALWGEVSVIFQKIQLSIDIHN